MKKTPIQKAEEYLQKAKDILANTPVVDVSDDGTLLHYADVKNVKKADGIEGAEYLIDMCKDIQSVIEQIIWCFED